MQQPAITPELVASHGVNESEYKLMEQILGRAPNYTELGIFSVIWSEHCSYKFSRVTSQEVSDDRARCRPSPAKGSIRDISTDPIVRLNVFKKPRVPFRRLAFVAQRRGKQEDPRPLP